MSLSRLIDRLHGWGRYCRHDEEGVRSCIASFWAKWIPAKGWMAEWGDPDAAPEHNEHAIDEQDAERIDGFVQQLPSWHRVALIRRYVHAHRPQTPYERETLRAAIDALADAMGENTRTVRHIRVLVRGRA